MPKPEAPATPNRRMSGSAVFRPGGTYRLCVVIRIACGFSPDARLAAERQLQRLHRAGETVLPPQKPGRRKSWNLHLAFPAPIAGALGPAHPGRTDWLDTCLSRPATDDRKTMAFTSQTTWK